MALPLLRHLLFSFNTIVKELAYVRRAGNSNGGKSNLILKLANLFDFALDKPTLNNYFQNPN